MLALYVKVLHCAIVWDSLRLDKVPKAAVCTATLFTGFLIIQFHILERRMKGAFTEYLVRMPLELGDERTAWVNELRIPPATIRQFEEDLSRRVPLSAMYNRSR